MAVTKPTPKDVGSYEAKLLGPFTQRQTICLAIGIIPCVLVSAILNAVGVDGYAIAAVCIFIMVLPCFFAFGSKICYGTRPEDFVIEYYRYHIKSRSVRLYETNTLDDKLDVVKQKEQIKEQKRLGIEEEPKAEFKKKQRPATKTKYKDMRFKEFGHTDSKEYRAVC